MIIDGDSSDIGQLEEDRDKEEEWTPNVVLTHGSSDSSEEEDLRDESVTQLSTEGSTEGPTTQDTTRGSARGKVKRKEYRWRKVQFEPPVVVFITVCY